jgi:ABC-type antimicrobial peptide transport system permease subunit
MDRNSKLFKVSIGLLVANLLMIFVIAFGFIFNLQTQQAVNQEEQVLGANNVPVFSPNYVMSDATFESTRAFPTEASVQAYLERVNSPLKNYSDQGQRASYWIFNRC